MSSSKNIKFYIDKLHVLFFAVYSIFTIKNCMKREFDRLINHVEGEGEGTLPQLRATIYIETTLPHLRTSLCRDHFTAIKDQSM